MIVLTRRLVFVHKTVQCLPHASDKHLVGLSIGYILHIRGLSVLKAHQIKGGNWQRKPLTRETPDKPCLQTVLR